MKEEIEKNEALEMMELGFDELCYKFYINSPKTLASDEIFRFRGIEEDIRRKNSYFFDSKEIITAPLYQQAFRWFREKHDLDYSLLPESSSGHRLLDRTFNIIIYKYYMNMNVQSEIFRIDGKIATYNKREEAEFACLKQLIEIVKNK